MWKLAAYNYYNLAFNTLLKLTFIVVNFHAIGHPVLISLFPGGLPKLGLSETPSSRSRHLGGCPVMRVGMPARGVKTAPKARSLQTTCHLPLTAGTAGGRRSKSDVPPATLAG